MSTSVINAEPRELTIVYISGSIGAQDLEKLNGRLGIPDLDALDDLRAKAKSAAGGANKKKEDEDNQ